MFFKIFSAMTGAMTRDLFRFVGKYGRVWLRTVGVICIVLVLGIGGLWLFRNRETITDGIPSVSSVATVSNSSAERLKSDVQQTFDSLSTIFIPDPSVDQNYDYDISEGYTYVYLNDNIPEFSSSDYTTEPFETYSPLDELGRCGAAYANICEDLMPEGEREEQLTVKPSGWKVAVYEDLIDNGGYLYNRCHLIGYFLAGENDNELNLITGTRYFNTEGMLPFEIEVGNYVERTGNHVLYRVTPVYTGDNLVADGVQMEAYSVEDHGKGVCYNVFVYNVQPGIEIDYATGDSWEER